MLTIKNPKTFDWANMSLVDCCEGNGADVYFTLKLYHLIEEKLEELGMMDLVHDLICPALTMFADMEYKGIDIVEDQLGAVGNTLRLANTEAEDELYDCEEVLSSDNMSSTASIIEVLYTREGAFELYPPMRTDKGKPSTAAKVLKTMLAQIEEELENRG